jgi:hypothetical protein
VLIKSARWCAHPQAAGYSKLLWVVAKVLMKILHGFFMTCILEFQLKMGSPFLTNQLPDWQGHEWR